MISEKERKKLITHAKKHKGGFSSPHMKKMVKHMKAGNSFIVAHNKSMMKKRKY